MEQIPATKFKISCLSVVERVRKTRKPVTITRYGKPVAEIRPAPKAVKKQRGSWLGRMEGTVQILGDIVGPSTTPDEWNALR